MSVKPIPDGYHTLTPFLTVRDAARAIEFYKQAFGAVERDIAKGPDGKIMHAELRLDDVNLNLLDEHDALRPFGTSNHQPVFFTRGVTLAGEPRMMKDKHRSFNFRHGRSQCRAVWWNSADEPLPPLPWDIAYTVSRNEWNGRVDAQLEIRGVRAASAM